MNDYTYLAHHGVKGMKWGVRKKSDRVSTSRADRRMARIDRRVDKRNAKIEKLSAKKHGTARYETMNDLRTANKVDKSRKNLISKKQTYKEAKGTSNQQKAKSDLKKARINYRTTKEVAGLRNLGIGTAAGFGYGKSARGSYVRSREMGRGKVNSFLRANGKQWAVNIAVAAGSSAVVAGGKAATNYYLKKKRGGSSLGKLPAYEILKAKNVKVY